MRLLISGIIVLVMITIMISLCKASARADRMEREYWERERKND